MKHCPECGKKLPQPNPKYCPECGAALSVAKKTPLPEVAKNLPAAKEVPAPEIVKPVPAAKKGGLLQTLGKLLILLFFLFLALLFVAFLALVGYFLISLPKSSQPLIVTTFMEGPVSGAAVRVYALSDNGTKGELLAGPAYSNEMGYADLNLSNMPPCLLIESSGGSYSEDAASGKAGSVTSVKLPDDYVMFTVMPSNSSIAVVTPFTNMAAALAMKSVEKGIPAERAVQFANAVVSQQYRIENITEIIPVAAYDSDFIALSTLDQREYGLLLAGLVQDARSLNAATAELSQALAQDWSDGVPDGTENGTKITLNDTAGKPVALPLPAALGNLQAGINKFMASPNHATHLQQFPISLKPVCADPNFYISTTNLPAWVDGTLGSFSLSAVGGQLPYSWKLKNGSTLPQGFILNAAGVLAGIGSLSPGTVESISPPFTVSVSDSSTPPKICEAELQIKIIEKPPELKTKDAVCQVDEECKVSVVASIKGGTPPYYYMGLPSSSGRYPPDLMLWNDGTIRGTPSTAGTYALYVCAIDLIGMQDCKDVTIVVNEKKPPQPFCGDGKCSNGETCATCTADCGRCQGNVCHSNSDCNGFASRNCGGSGRAVCDSSGKCHCCLVASYGGAVGQCLDCSNCYGGYTCINGRCAYQSGGSPSQ